MVVVAPPATHESTGCYCSLKSWRSRGWCRVEYAAAILSPKEVRIVLIEGPEYEPYFTYPIDYLFLLPGEGEYTCCARNHDFGNGPVPCDKTKVTGVLPSSPYTCPTTHSLTRDRLEPHSHDERERKH